MKEIGFIIDSLTSDGAKKYMGICKIDKSPFGRRIDIRCVDYSAFYTGLLYFTGSKNFNISGNFLESCNYHPISEKKNHSFCGNAWNWTSSYYIPYPGFKPFKGILAEYNNKFMANQLVLRGGSCLTPKSHYRHTYRNFFYPYDRWQMSSIRLAI